jgi:predicted transcriptional regulator
MGKVKEAVLELAKNLPEECTWEEVLYQVYIRKQIDAGLKDEAEGRLVPHEKVFTKYFQKKVTHE